MSLLLEVSTEKLHVWLPPNRDHEDYYKTIHDSALVKRLQKYEQYCPNYEIQAESNTVQAENGHADFYCDGRPTIRKSTWLANTGRLSEAEELYRFFLVFPPADQVEQIKQAEAHLGLARLAMMQQKKLNHGNDLRRKLLYPREQLWLSLIALCEVEHAEKILEILLPTECSKTQHMTSRGNSRIVITTKSTNSTQISDLLKQANFVKGQLQKKVDEIINLFLVSDSKQAKQLEMNTQFWRRFLLPDADKFGDYSIHSIREDDVEEITEDGNTFLDEICQYFTSRSKNNKIIVKNIETEDTQQFASNENTTSYSDNEEFIDNKKEILVKEQMLKRRPQSLRLGLGKKIKNCCEKIERSVSDIRERLGLRVESFSKVSGKHSVKVSDIMDRHRKQMEIAKSTRTNAILEYEATSALREVEIEDLSLLNRSSRIRRSDTIADLRSSQGTTSDYGSRPSSANKRIFDESFYMRNIPEQTVTTVSTFNENLLSSEEIFSTSDIMSVNSNRTRSNNESEDTVESLKFVYHLLAKSLYQIGQLFESKDLYLAAMQVYQQAIYLIRQSMPSIGLNSHLPVELLVPLLHRTGILRCRTDDIVNGICLLNRGVELLQQNGPRVVHSNMADRYYFQLSSLLFELGNAYFGERNGLIVSRNAICMAIREHVEKEAASDESPTLFKDAQYNLNPFTYSDKKDSVSDTRNCILFPALEVSENYALLSMGNLKKSFEFYTQSESILKKISGEEKDAHSYKNLKVLLLARLGDCHLLQGQYQQAVDFYEETLPLFPQTLDSLLSNSLMATNSHVLYMLGVARLLLSNYSKALSVLECAQLVGPRTVNALQQESEVGLAATNNAADIQFFVTGLLTICSGYSSGQHHKAIFWGHRCVTYCQQIYGDTLESVLKVNDIWLLSEVFALVAKAYMQTEEYYLSQKFAQTFLKLKGDKLVENNQNVQYARLMIIIADNFYIMDEYDSAIKVYKDALLQLSSSSETDVSDFYCRRLSTLLGRTLLTVGEMTEGSMYLEKGLGNSLLGSASRKLDSCVYKEIASEALLNGNLDQALVYLKASVELHRDQKNQSLSFNVLPLLAQLVNVIHAKLVICKPAEKKQLIKEADEYYRLSTTITFIPELATKYSIMIYNHCEERREESLQLLQTTLDFCHQNPGHLHLITLHNYELCTILPIMLQKEFTKLFKQSGNHGLSFSLKAYVLFLISYITLGRKETEKSSQTLATLKEFIEKSTSYNDFSQLAIHRMLFGYILILFNDFESAKDILMLYDESSDITNLALSNITYIEVTNL